MESENMKIMVVKATGQTPVEVIDQAKFLNRMNGDIFGMPPKDVEAAVADGLVRVVPIPKGVDAEEYAPADAGKTAEPEKKDAPAQKSTNAPAGAMEKADA